MVLEHLTICSNTHATFFNLTQDLPHDDPWKSCEINMPFLLSLLLMKFIGGNIFQYA